jgi:hypothetical protein
MAHSALTLVNIANQALSHIGSANTIAALSETNTEARQCNLWMETARLQVLEAFDWSFARRRARLESHAVVAAEDTDLYSTVITGATAANPVVITSVAHGYASTDIINIEADSVVGMTQLNGLNFNITRLTADTYSLQTFADGTVNVNGTAYTAYTSGGTVTLVYSHPGTWLYRYVFPTDAVFARRIHNTAGPTANAIPFEVAVDPTGILKSILTDEPNAILVYTADMSTPAMFSFWYVKALGHLLASYIAMPITGVRAIKNEQFQLYADAIRKASAFDANQQAETPPREASWITDRA